MKSRQVLIRTRHRIHPNFFGGWLMALLMLFVMQPAHAQQAGEMTHQVTAGQTLYQIAREYNVSVVELREWNQLENDNLRVGQTLTVRPPVDGDTTIHVVQAGETLFAISRQYNVSVAELQEWNQLAGNVLSSGQRLRIHAPDAPVRSQESSEPSQTAETELQTPSEPDPQTEPVQIDRSLLEGATATRVNTYYTVRSGDNLGRIAREHNMTVRELRELNDLSGDVIRVGQRLIVRQESSTPIHSDGASAAISQGSFTRHRVGSRDNLNRILQQYQMNRNELQALNPGMELSRIREGQQLTVLVPPERTFRNPYRDQQNLENLGEVPLTRYGGDHRALPTTSGELYNPELLTAAHASIALGQVIFVENPGNGRGVYVRINDRTEGEGLRLSAKAHQLLGLQAGVSARGLIYQEL